ncbi:MAG: hypothetical protein JWR69_2810 [Pedosphaera sp.]|nr:hypothetical protein [Pedosphaera sp.]
MSQPSPQQIKAVANQILKTWWVWLGLAIIIWSGLLLVEKVTRYQARSLQGELAQSASNQVAQSLVVISNALRTQVMQSASNQLASGFGNISNQIATALGQPQIQATIEAVAAQQATQLMFGAISPAISNFQAKLSQAQARLDTTPISRARASKDGAKPSEPAAPAGLVLDTQSISKQGSSYALTVAFKRINDTPLGGVRFMIGAFNQLPARILAVDVESDSDPAVERTIDSSRLEATLNFTPLEKVDPVIKILLSGPTVMQITCDALPEPVTVPVLVNLPNAKTSSR